MGREAGRAVWLCAGHWQIVAELRTGRLRRTFDSLWWRLTGRGRRRW